jgi:hypothetical protein
MLKEKIQYFINFHDFLPILGLAIKTRSKKSLIIHLKNQQKNIFWGFLNESFSSKKYKLSLVKDI